jgi:hypothetical protein
VRLPGFSGYATLSLILDELLVDLIAVKCRLGVLSSHSVKCSVPSGSFERKCRRSCILKRIVGTIFS